MVVTAVLDLSGYPLRVARRITRSGFGPFLVLSAALAAILMNDTALFLVVPLTLRLSKEKGYDPAKAVALITAAVNVGSALTAFGNPQNIMIWRMDRASIPEFSRVMLPYCLAGLIVLLVLSRILLGEGATAGEHPPLRSRPELLLLGSALLVMDLVLIETGNWPIALALSIGLTAPLERYAVAKINPRILLMIFLVVLDLRALSTVVPVSLFSGRGLLTYVWILMLCQLMGNVPATSLFLGSVDWRILAPLVNLGGLGLVTASLANLIALRLSAVEPLEFQKWSLLILLLCALAFLPLFFL